MKLIVNQHYCSEDICEMHVSCFVAETPTVSWVLARMLLCTTHDSLPCNRFSDVRTLSTISSFSS